MASFAQDVRFASRLLFRNPGHTVVAVLALGLGIGLSTAMFSILYGAMFRGLPVPEPERLMHVENANPSRDQPSLEVFLHDFLDYSARQKAFESLSAYSGGTLNLSGDGDPPERFDGLFSSANLFTVLGVRPLHGRGFLPGEDLPAAEPVAILSYGVWKSRYNGDPKVIGKAVRINGEPGTIVGVMPFGFAFPDSTAVWAPMRDDPLRIERGKGETLEVMGRLRRGVTLEQAKADVGNIARTLATEYPKTHEGRVAVVKPWMEEAMGGEIAGMLWLMLGSGIAVLLIACTNVASLTMARASKRTREIAVRAALGASRKRLIAQLLLETCLLSLFGGILGVALGAVGVKLFNNAIASTNPPFWIKIAVDPAALGFTLGITLLAGFLAGLLPALQTSRTQLAEVLQDEGRGSSSLRLGWFTRFVVIAEVALSCILLVNAGLMIKSVVKLKTADLGFDVSRLFTARIALFEAAYPKEADRLVFFENLLARLESQPGVAAVAATTNLPGGGSGMWQYRLEGRAYATERDLPEARMAVVSPGFFQVYGAKILAGEGFDAGDTATNLPVVVVNKSFAQEVWPGEDPLGKRLRMEEEPGDVTDPPWRTVIGVVPDLQMAGLGGRDQRQAGFYIPLAQRCPGFVSLTVRTRTADPMTITPVVRQEVTALDKDLPIYFVRSTEEILAQARFFPNLFGSLFAILGVAALVLASVGIYGVIAFSVNRRTQEIGIRMALGAQRRNVQRMILRQGMLQLLFGLGAGLPAALGLAFLLANFLFGVQPRDPLTFTVVTALLAGVAFVACLIPARRAIRTDPLVAIRYD